jgi:hypothetical protein
MKIRKFILVNDVTNEPLSFEEAERGNKRIRISGVPDNIE